MRELWCENSATGERIAGTFRVSSANSAGASFPGHCRFWSSPCPTACHCHTLQPMQFQCNSTLAASTSSHLYLLSAPSSSLATCHMRCNLQPHTENYCTLTGVLQTTSASQDLILQRAKLNFNQAPLWKLSSCRWIYGLEQCMCGNILTTKGQKSGWWIKFFKWNL